MKMNKKGFTLIELLIVVAIIAILAAIAIPQFSAYKKRGYAAELNSDAKNALTALSARMADNVTISPGTCDNSITPGYIKSPNVATCVVSAGTSTGDYIVTITGGANTLQLANYVAEISTAGTFTPAVAQ